MTASFSVESSLLLEIPVPFRLIDGVLCMEAQAYNGICRWLENFEKISVCAILDETTIESSTEYKSIAPLAEYHGLTFYPLPYGYKIKSHYRHRKEVASLFKGLIPQHKYLCFSNLGWWGGWGSVASQIAYEMNRPYSVWLDWVLHEMPIDMTKNIMRNAFRVVRSWRTKHIVLRSVRQSSLGLFHGRTVFDAYAPICRVSEVVHDVHLKKTDIINMDRFVKRITVKRKVIKVGYVGRVHPMKGPFQWMEVLKQVLSAIEYPLEIKAVWLGDGPLLEESRHKVVEDKLDSSIEFSGRESERERVLDFLRDLDIFLFCHLTPESPRCLIESLMSGVPIIGYASAYAEDLIANHGGGQFVPPGDVAALAKLIINIASDHALLQELSKKALRSGSEFSDDAVFSHRSQLIKKYLA